MPDISITNDKLMSTEEWESIFGTTMHEKMLINRLVVGNVIDKEPLIMWLHQNCHSFYYYTVDDIAQFAPKTIRVYILNEADVLHFKMKWDGHEEEGPAFIKSPTPVSPLKSNIPRIPKYQNTKENKYHFEINKLKKM